MRTKDIRVMGKLPHKLNQNNQKEFKYEKQSDELKNRTAEKKEENK
jgi:hypothetical protein